MWKKGQSGNPSGARREQKFRDALERAIVQDKGKRLRKAAEALLDNAAEGQPWALNMLADRVDGKADQTINVVRTAREMSDDDLLRVAAASSDGTVGEESSEDATSKVH